MEEFVGEVEAESCRAGPWRHLRRRLSRQPLRGGTAAEGGGNAGRPLPDGDAIGKETPFWWDELARIILSNANPSSKT
jgi:hypothetical protein